MSAAVEFVGKAVIITGSSRGIGRAAALAFAKQGASVTIHGQSTEKLKETEELLKKAGVNAAQICAVLGPIQEEKTAQELVDKTVKAFGRIDVLINNAAIWQVGEGKDDQSLENFDHIFNVNLRSVVQLTALAVPHLAKTKGNVITVSSVAAIVPMKASMYYGMAKAALEHYTRDIANTLGQAHGIRVNCVRPGPISTDFRIRFIGEELDKQWEDSYCSKTLANRPGSDQECADAMTFLTSQKSSYIWGATITVDGGRAVYAEH